MLSDPLHLPPTVTPARVPSPLTAGLKPESVAALVEHARTVSPASWGTEEVKVGQSKQLTLAFRSVPTSKGGPRGEILATRGDKGDRVQFITPGPPKSVTLLTGAAATELYSQLLLTVAIKPTLTDAERTRVLAEAVKGPGWNAQTKGVDRSGLPPGTLHRFYAKPVTLPGVRLGTLKLQLSQSGMVEASNLHFEATGGVTHAVELTDAQVKTLKNALGARNSEASVFEYAKK